MFEISHVMAGSQRIGTSHGRRMMKHNRVSLKIWVEHSEQLIMLEPIKRCLATIFANNGEPRIDTNQSGLS